MDDDPRALATRQRESAGLAMAELSTAIVRIYKEQFGRGPTKAHSTYATDDIVVCSIEDSLIPAERRMAELGEHQRLRDIRTFFQHATEAEFVSAAERATGRKVRAFVSGIDTGQDVSSEVFYLYPRTDSPNGA